MAKPVENKAKKPSNVRIYCACRFFWRIGSVIGSVKQEKAHHARGKMGRMLDFIGFVDLIGYGIDRLFYSGLHVGKSRTSLMLGLSVRSITRRSMP